MRMRAGTDVVAPSPDGRAHRWFERFLDFFSPTLTCPTCGSDSKLRRCERTGEIRSPTGSGEVGRWSPVEVEFVCPVCLGSIWYLDTSTAYPYPAF